MPPFRAYRVVLAAMADGSSELNEAEMSDLDRLQLRINQKSDETLDSTRRMREMRRRRGRRKRMRRRRKRRRRKRRVRMRKRVRRAG